MLHGAIFFYEWRKKSTGTVLWAMLFVVFTLPHTAHILAGDYPQHVLDEATVFVILFMGIYFLCRILYYGKVNRCPGRSIEMTDFSQTPQSLVDFLLVVYFLSFLIVAIGFYGRGYSLSQSTWSEVLHMDMTVAEKLATKIIVAFSGLGFVCFCRKEKYRFLLLFAIFVFYLVLSKSRYNILGFVTPFMIYFLFNKERKKVVGGVAAGVLLVFAVFVFQQIRWLGGFSNFLAVGFDEVLARSVEYMKAGNGELGLLKAFYFFIEKGNAFPDFGEGNGFVRLALMIFPSSLLVFKPRDFAIDMYREWFKVDNPTGTMHPTVFGDAYANAGFAGSCAGGFCAVLVSFVDECVNRTADPTLRMMKISMACTMLVLLGRGAMYNSIFNFIVGWLLLEMLYAVYRLFMRRRKRKHEDLIY